MTGLAAVRRINRRIPIKGKPTRANTNPPGAGTGTALVFTSVLEVAVNVVAVFTGTTLIVSVWTIENGFGRLATLPFVIGPLPEDVDDGRVVTPLIVDVPETVTLPPPFSPLDAPASFKKAAVEPAELFGNPDAVRVMSNPSVVLPTGKFEVIPKPKEVESDTAFAAGSTPKVTEPPIVKLLVVSVEPPLGRFSVPFEVRDPRS